ncbi:MAG: nucleoside phosphorylase [Candidatus Thiodiazotropha endolucinida]|nr:nucleoside phosphorylase [Candidatus Thiodiazotropha taylori]MCW4316704.1 nucleoside phosphorylase [Candidatus Thiodiazotropha taylori]
MMDHLGITITEARQAIITGDPQRIPAISDMLGGGKLLSDKRGLVCWEAADEKGNATLIVSTGIGGPSTAIVVEELAELGVQTIVRLGTCGGLQKDIIPNDLIIPTGCVRDEGTTAQYIESTFPAVPDFTLTRALLDSLQSSEKKCHIGIVHCKDAYYMEHADRQLLPENVSLRWKMLQKAGVVATEMESSTLFVIGSIRRLRVGSVLIAIGSQPDPQGFSSAMEMAISAISAAFSSLPDLQYSAETMQNPRHSYLEKGVD